MTGIVTVMPTQVAPGVCRVDVSESRNGATFARSRLGGRDD